MFTKTAAGTMRVYNPTGLLEPGDTIVVLIKGTEKRRPMDTSGAWGVTGSVWYSGVTPVKENPCWVGAGFNGGYRASCEGAFEYSVHAGADKVVIAFQGNFGIGSAVVHTWEKSQPRKP
jgi:hypothetical protein